MSEVKMSAEGRGGEGQRQGREIASESLGAAAAQCINDEGKLIYIVIMKVCSEPDGAEGARAALVAPGYRLLRIFFSSNDSQRGILPSRPLFAHGGASAPSLGKAVQILFYLSPLICGDSQLNTNGPPSAPPAPGPDAAVCAVRYRSVTKTV